MSNYDDEVFERVMRLLDRPISFNRAFVTITGSVTAGLMLSQAFYWAQRTTKDPDGWFFKTQEEWKEETGLSRSEQESARKILRAIGVFEEKKQGVPCRLFFRLNVRVLFSRLMEPPKESAKKTAKKQPDGQQTSMQESRKLECNLSANKYVGIPQTGMQESYKQDRLIPADNLYTENTTEITTETTYRNTPLTPQGELVEVEIPFSDWEPEEPDQENRENLENLEPIEPLPSSREIKETSSLARNLGVDQISPAAAKKTKAPTKSDIAQCFEAFRLKYNELMGDIWSRCDKATPDRLKNFTRTWAEHGQELFESLEYASVYLHQAEWARKERRSIDTILWSGRLTKYAESGKSGNATKSANDRAEEIMAKTYARAMALENATLKVEALAS